MTTVIVALLKFAKVIVAILKFAKAPKYFRLTEKLNKLGNVT